MLVSYLFKLKSVYLPSSLLHHAASYNGPQELQHAHRYRLLVGAQLQAGGLRRLLEDGPRVRQHNQVPTRLLGQHHVNCYPECFEPGLVLD